MSDLITVKAGANIAFVKYWGFLPGSEYMPCNESISMTLENCHTITTASRNPDLSNHQIVIKNELGVSVPLDATTLKGRAAFVHLEQIRARSQSKEYLDITSINTFPSDAGIASSASGMCALTGAAVLAYDMRELFEDKKNLSILARKSGSASAARSVYGGYVRLHTGKRSEDAYAQQILDEQKWPLVDLIAIVSSSKKTVSSSAGHLLSHTSELYPARLSSLSNRIKRCVELIKHHDLCTLGKMIEKETLSLHAIMMTSEPALIYWQPATLAVINALLRERGNGLEAFFSIDAGANVHIITTPQYQHDAEKLLQSIPGVSQIIHDQTGKGMSEVIKTI